MLRNLLACALLTSIASAAAAAEPVMRKIPDAAVVGEGRLSFAFWDVYDATLYAPRGEMNQQAPFALSIRYMREIEGADIAERSVEEMRAQGFADETRLTSWNQQMKEIFPDVKDGTVLTAIFIPGGETMFYEDNTPVGTIKDAEFTRWFSDIWLSEKTSEPGLRRELLGQS
jgi:hypothetical protein